MKQRKARKIRNDSGGVWVPNFFREIPHPFIEGEVRWDVIKGENDYWHRRERKDWSGLPDLWSENN